MYSVLKVTNTFRNRVTFAARNTGMKQDYICQLLHRTYYRCPWSKSDPLREVAVTQYRVTTVVFNTIPLELFC